MIQAIHAFYRPDLGLLPRDKERLRPVLHLHPKNHVIVVTDCTGRHRLGECISWSIRGSLTSEVVPRSNSYTRRDGVNAALGLGGALALLLSFSRIFLKSCDIPKHFIEGVLEAIKESSLLVINYESCFHLLLKPVKKVLIPEFQDSKGILLLLSREWRYLIVCSYASNKSVLFHLLFLTENASLNMIRFFICFSVIHKTFRLGLSIFTCYLFMSVVQTLKMQ